MTQAYFQLRKKALENATEEWYEELDDDVKEWVDEKVAELKESVKARANGNSVQYGDASARETLCALIAFCDGWRPTKI